LKILVDNKELSVIAANHVLDGIDCCCVGFLKSKLTQFSELYEGVLGQLCQAALLLLSSLAYLKKKLNI